ncbi:hypothetical protein HYV31_02555 [candidate division WWE3 bacterium]|nr:hypothetical protein [candidate division WWE3 bacterium]
MNSLNLIKTGAGVKTLAFIFDAILFLLVVFGGVVFRKLLWPADAPIWQNFAIITLICYLLTRVVRVHEVVIVAGSGNKGQVSKDYHFFEDTAGAIMFICIGMLWVATLSSPFNYLYVFLIFFGVVMATLAFNWKYPPAPDTELLHLITGLGQLIRLVLRNFRGITVAVLLFLGFGSKSIIWGQNFGLVQLMVMVFFIYAASYALSRINDVTRGGQIDPDKLKYRDLFSVQSWPFALFLMLISPMKGLNPIGICVWTLIYLLVIWFHLDMYFLHMWTKKRE